MFVTFEHTLEHTHNCFRDPMHLRASLANRSSTIANRRGTSISDRDSGHKRGRTDVYGHESRRKGRHGLRLRDFVFARREREIENGLGCASAK